MSLDLVAGIHIDHNFTRLRQIAQSRSYIDGASGNTMCASLHVYFTGHNQASVDASVHRNGLPDLVFNLRADRIHQLMDLTGSFDKQI